MVSFTPASYLPGSFDCEEINMKILHIMAVLFATSSSFAVPLIGSSASFAESNFCKHYKCKYVGTDSMDVGKLFHYSLTDGAEIEVGRDNDSNVVSFVTLIYRYQSLAYLIGRGIKGAPYLKDLIKTVTGVSTSYDLYNQCVKYYDPSRLVSFGKVVLARNIKLNCDGISADGADRTGMSPTPTIVFNFLKN